MKIKLIGFVNTVIIIQIVLTLLSSIIISYSSNLGFLTYVPDILNVILLGILISKHGKFKLKAEYLLLLIFILYVILSSFWGERDLYYIVVHGARYLSAFIIFYYSSEFLTYDKWKKGLNILLLIQGLNMILTAYQNLVLKLHPDFCNGIFGFTSFNNALQGTFAIFLSSIAMVYYIDKKWSLKKMIYTIGTSCVVCAFAEVKIYFVMLLVNFFVLFLVKWNDKKVRKKLLVFIIVMALLLVTAYKILEAVFPDNLATFFSLSRYFLYEEYGAHNGAGRLNTISYIYNNVFEKDSFMSFFGKGFGPIMDNYAYTVGKLFVSVGFLGLLLFFIWLIKVGIDCLKNIRNSSESTICLMSIITLIISMFVWNGIFTQIVFLVFWIIGAKNLEHNNQE